MAVRNAKAISITSWSGLDQFTDKQEVAPDAFVNSSNVVVTPNQNVLPLRSPANFNNALSTGNPVISGSDYARTAGNVIIYDINLTSGSNVATYVTTVGGVNTQLRTGQAAAAFQSLNVNDCLFRVNGIEFIQYTTGLILNGYAVGIAGPAAAPTASIVSGGSGTFDVGVYVSYAYYNTTTGHTGLCSDPSALSGPTSGSNNNLQVAVVASAQAGVSNIVLFVSEDGGTVRYLLIDTNGNPQLFANTTGNITVSVANTFLDTNTEETAFNNPPPAGITNISRWKNRIIGAFGRMWAYSGFDQIAMGVPWETWPPLNLLTVPNKGETVQGGIETQVGYLGLTDLNAYLLSGNPSDQIDSGNNTLQVTEQVDQLGWNLGTLSPQTIQNTPYGTVWLDNNKHLQMWTWEGAPIPLAIGIWPDLANIQSSQLSQAQATWFPAGGADGGFYVLTASISGSVNNKIWIVMMMKTSKEGSAGYYAGLSVCPSPSSVVAQCVFNARINGALECFIGVTDRLRQFLNFTLQGAGWSDSDRLYFDTVIGNQATNFNGFHSFEINGVLMQDAIVRVSEIDGSNSETIPLREEFGSYFGMVDRYGTRHQMHIEFPNDDSGRREIKNLRLITTMRNRVI